MPKSSYQKRAFHFKRCRFFYILPCFVLFTVFLSLVNSSQKENYADERYRGRSILDVPQEEPKRECVPPSIDSFPSDFFTQEQRLQGGVVVHFIILVYLCAMLAVVCDDYFVPSLDIICKRLKLPSDVAGATFMAIGTSSPELFSSIIGAFITEGDIGVGTIVGSAVFNILGVTGLAGMVLWNKEIDVDWYPVTRDCSVYIVTVAALTIVISNNIVTWWEALIMLVMFGMYIVLMYFNSTVEKFSQKQMKRMKRTLKNCSCFAGGDDERTPLLGNESNTYTPELIDNLKERQRRCDSYSVDLQPGLTRKASEKSDEVRKDEPVLEIESTDDDDGSLCSPPKSAWKKVWWLLMWPSSLLFLVTVPDCRKKRLEKFFGITFLLSTVWLGALSYLSVWMVTVIGYTLSIPDTVSGLTLLAVGTSLPEILSSVIVVRSGLGNMVMSNLIGSNIFDILFCLGAPWFIKTLSTDDGYLVINSSAMTYTTTTLLATVFVLLLIFHFSSWKLNRTMGIICLLIYGVFIALACLYELNIFGEINPPPC